MQSRNPAFTRSPAFSDRRGYATFQQPAMSPADLQSMYDAPPATPLETGRMSYDDVVAKTGISFTVLLLGVPPGARSIERADRAVRARRRSARQRARKGTRTPTREAGRFKLPASASSATRARCRLYGPCRRRGPDPAPSACSEPGCRCTSS